MCSTTRGPAIWPSLVTWPTSTTAAPDFLAKRVSACAEVRTWVTVPGAQSTRSVHSVWMESMMTRCGAVACLQRREDDLDIGLGGQLHVGAAEAEPLRAEPDLGHRLFARDVDDALAALGQRRRGLQQERRFADARVAADQHGRAHDEAAAGDPVELADAGGDARRAISVSPASGTSATGRPAGGGRSSGPAPTPRIDHLLDDGVPLAAALAAALPAHMRGAAGLADIGGLGFGHGGLHDSLAEASRRGKNKV